jgi:hypothetical protein
MMRVLPSIGMLLVSIGRTPSRRARTRLIQLCNLDPHKCQKIVGLVIGTGVDHVPSCLANIDPQDLSQQILAWWAADPKQADNPVVLAVAWSRCTPISHKK